MDARDASSARHLSRHEYGHGWEVHMQPLPALVARVASLLGLDYNAVYRGLEGRDSGNSGPVNQNLSTTR